jgi:hypothetical protein
MLCTSCKVVGPDSEDESSNALIFPSCGPTDGPALAVYLDVPSDARSGHLPLSVGIDVPANASFTYVYLIGMNSPEEDTFELNVAGNEHSVVGWAYRCTAGQLCARSTEGTVTFATTGEEGYTSVTVDLQFEDGSHITSAYLAEVREQAYICG